MVNAIVKMVGWLWICLYLLAYAGVIDLNVCISGPGACNAKPAPAKAKVIT